jgi:hypothetical protein
VYELDDATVQVVYSRGGCSGGESGGWNIPPDTVIRFNVHPKKRQLIGSLDLSKYTKTEDPELPGIFYYTDAKGGLVISTDCEYVLNFGFEPMAQDDGLRCPGSLADQPKVTGDPHKVV